MSQNQAEKMPARYDGLSISLHWLSVALVLAAIALIEIKGWLPKGSDARDAAKFWHFQAGALVLLATLCRIVWLFKRKRPAPVALGGGIVRQLGHAMHGLFYVLLLALPLLGIGALVVAGKPVDLLGWTVPVWDEGSSDTAKTIKGIHELLGDLMIGLVLMHVAAALWHQFIHRDGLIQRMLPRRRVQ